MASYVKNPQSAVDAVKQGYESTKAVAQGVYLGTEMLARVLTMAAVLYGVAYALGFSIARNGFFLDILVPGREFDQLMVLFMIAWGLAGFGTDMLKAFGVAVVSTSILAVGQTIVPRSI